MDFEKRWTGSVQNLQRELIFIKVSGSFSAVNILLTRCVKKVGKSFHTATSASSFSGVQGSPAMLVTIFESKLDVTCLKAGLSLVV